jgi:hypothetical protein
MSQTKVPQRLYPEQKMRVIPWSDPTDKGQMGYTLVMEWFRVDGSIEKDERRQMGAAEFAALLASANQAAALSVTDFA